ncbi:hypothetical protein quinque_008751 [Culex quinquefasciatus]|uniref:Uncharacterized protein n=1 Tax=Culex pipiens pipiens TaxID=38569 RepID=A0ABD1CE46_CULPP
MKRRPTPSAVASENNPDREEKGDEALGLGSSSAPYGVTTKASSGFEHLFHQRVALEFVENPKDDSVEFTHLIVVDEATIPQNILDDSKVNDQYEENEPKYKALTTLLLQRCQQ